MRIYGIVGRFLASVSNNTPIDIDPLIHPPPPPNPTNFKPRHECTARRYGDNIGGHNYEALLSYGPIDVVYTWVNGSDPRWLASKRRYERWVGGWVVVCVGCVVMWGRLGWVG